MFRLLRLRLVGRGHWPNQVHDHGCCKYAHATLRELSMYLPRIEDRSFREQAPKGMEEWWELMEERGTRTEKPQVVA